MKQTILTDMSKVELDVQPPELFFRTLEDDINEARKNKSNDLWVRALNPISSTEVVLYGEGQNVCISSAGILKSALPDGANKWDFINEVKESLERSHVVLGSEGGGNWIGAYVTVHDIYLPEDAQNYLGFLTLVGTPQY